MTNDKDTITIIVNGREKVVSKDTLSSNDEISFEDILKLAFDPIPTNPDIIFHVLYSNSPGRPPKGRLTQGGSVKVQNGTIFNVSKTDKS